MGGSEGEDSESELEGVPDSGSEDGVSDTQGVELELEPIPCTEEGSILYFATASGLKG